MIERRRNGDWMTLNGHWNVPAIQSTEWWLKGDWMAPFRFHGMVAFRLVLILYIEFPEKKFWLAENRFHSDRDIVINNPDQLIFPDPWSYTTWADLSTVVIYTNLNNCMLLHIDRNQYLDIEKQTEAQSCYKTWHEFPRNCITSSLFNEIAAEEVVFKA